MTSQESLSANRELARPTGRVTSRSGVSLLVPRPLVKVFDNARQDEQPN
jgi:hypothetical protein